MLKITIDNQVKVLSFLLFGTFLMLGYLIFFNQNQYAIKIFFWWWIINTLPALYLHIEYYLKNRSDEFQIDQDKIIHVRKDVETEYKTDELKKITVYMSPNKFKNSSLQYLPMESYSYAEIITKSDKKIIITNLLLPNLEKKLRKLRGVPYERKKKIFCSIDPI